jgi:hypothetical protein
MVSSLETKRRSGAPANVQTYRARGRGAPARHRSIQLPTTAWSLEPRPSSRTASSTRAVKARDPTPGPGSSGLPMRTTTGAGRKNPRP